jgi:hypothetical protein
MNDIVYIDHMKIARPGVAILDMQMSKVPIISGYAVGCPIFLLSILIAKYLFTGSLKK